MRTLCGDRVRARDRGGTFLQGDVRVCGRAVIDEKELPDVESLSRTRCDDSVIATGTEAYRRPGRWLAVSKSGCHGRGYGDGHQTCPYEHRQNSLFHFFSNKKAAQWRPRERDFCEPRNVCGGSCKP